MERMGHCRTSDHYEQITRDGLSILEKRQQQSSNFLSPGARHLRWGGLAAQGMVVSLGVWFLGLSQLVNVGFTHPTDFKNGSYWVIWPLS